MKPEGMSEARLNELDAWSQARERIGFDDVSVVRELVAEVRRLRGALKVVGDEGLEINGRLLTENASLASKLATAVEALRWYADGDNYDEGSSFLRGLSKVQDDKGWCADAALKSIEGGGGFVIQEDPSLQPDRVEFRQDGKLVGVIENLGDGHDQAD